MKTGQLVHGANLSELQTTLFGNNSIAVQYQDGIRPYILDVRTT